MITAVKLLDHDSFILKKFCWFSGILLDQDRGRELI
jgi:hypothetical protein